MRPAALLPAVLLALAACASTPQPSPASSAVPPPATPSPVATEAPSPSADPSTATAPPAATLAATNTPAPSMTPDEEALMGALRADAAVRCAPRRADLPVGALYGIECRPDDSSVARVGIYRFASPNEAAYAYMTRMADAGVDVNAGDCGRDIPGDAPWTPGDNEGSLTDPGVFNFENSVLSPNRSGCFLDANGTANVRATCGNAYIGVLGTETDLSDLNDWTWRYPEGYEPGTPDAPGICVGDGLVTPEDVAAP